MKENLRHARPMRLFALGVFGLAFLLLPALSAHANPPPPRVHPAAGDTAASNPLLQFTSQGHVLGFDAGGFYVSNATYALRVEFVEAHPVAPTSDAASQPEANQPGATPLSRVTYSNLWDGITLVYDGTRGGVVSSSYRVEPGADARSIRLRYNAPVALNADGTLTIAYATGEMIESAPLAWQEVAGERVAVPAEFELRGEREIGFALGAYDDGQPLFIDPTLTWTTFLGGGGDDDGSAIAVDASGNVYVAGTSDAMWASPVRGHTGGYDAFAAKLNSSGVLTWNTFLGGSGNDYGNAIAIDASGNVYVVGYSQGGWGSPVRPFGSGPDAFAAKLNSGGGLIWNTFLGGGGVDYGNGVAVDGSGNVYVAGESDATWQSPVRGFTGGYDAFAVKLNSGGGLMWNTFLGGVSSDYGNAIAVDGSGNVYVAGSSEAAWGSPVRVYNSLSDAFAAKLNSSGALVWNTFLGGSGWDFGIGIAVDASGNVYVSGDSSATWQGSSAPVRAYTGSYDAFAVKLGPGGAVIWSTFLGGGAPDSGYGIRVDGSGSVYVAGFSSATWQAASPPVRAYSGLYDTFAVKLNSGGGVIWNTFLGGNGWDYGYAAIAVDASGNVYVAGNSDAAWGSPVRFYTAQVDAFAAKMSSSGALTWNAFFGGLAYDYSRAIALDASGNIYVAGSSNTRWGSPVRSYSAGYDGFAVKLNSSGDLVWNTFLGGYGKDEARGITVDNSGNVYVSGYSDWTWGGPTIRAYTSLNDGFVAKLNSTGGLVWNSFLGGNGNDYANAIAVDGSQNVYVVGDSTAEWGALIVRHYTLLMDAYAAKLSSNGTLAWTTFLGGLEWDTGASVAVDAIGNVYAAGASDASWMGINLPARAYTGGTDAFAAKVNPGGAVVWNSFLGGTGRDVGSAMVIDSVGNVYVGGYSNATWQGLSSPVRAYTSGYDAFAAKVNSSGGLTWNSFLGGSGNEYGLGVGVDASGNVYVSGYSSATWGSPVRGYTGADDGFAAKTSSSGSLKWNTFLGGSGYDYGYSIDVDGRGNVYVAGDSGSAWPGVGAPRRAYLSGTDAFVATIGAFDGYLPLMSK